ncbi:MAG: DNA-binding response regulator [Sphingobacteriia bacterium 24-36-13]|jgi:DNA-binding NarL/FixJ family response regulator|uniref:response regulator transcription factor n=1 Tax=Sediminibacterium sp. TaxID=1917865 RepID=UPI000BD3865E|nr:response regulator transcription factor [Sediminibacterium sp.]OYY08488.1 MAG: DNA-binding response regulator [Sphingobacteriia bacterium 35-36-14]OYZ52301.1 MAG: DNA-binding response regulator [Sphingobacteriia bacterium 24-36-13]OZA63723.1 MAG: DNA-binding response regulator [Sphingobacteriia bacterium 39-36-14]HQS24598.1 response regulator transcription factor [Sediminibacterium sp.]HQS34712.1 response regulator transcription factor [Sediminibacterium sp.]
MKKIVLVDDHILLRNGLAGIIAGFDNFNVLFEANNGSHFIEQLDPSNLPDIVLLDITMPVMNGFETAEWIFNNHPSIKVMVLSMLNDERTIIKMLKFGAMGYMTKDTDPKELNRALNELYNKGIYFNQLLCQNLVHSVRNGLEEPNDEYQIFLNLPEREKEFLKLLATDLTLKEIAAKMNLSPRTIDGYRDNLFEKVKVSNRVGLVLFALRNNLIHL